MVAEPVLATLGALRATYDSAARFLHAQADILPDTATFWDALPLTLKNASPATQNPPPASLFERISSTSSAHKHMLLGAAFTTAGLGGLMLHSRSRDIAASSSKRRRRTPKLPNGARRDVVFVVGSPTEPMTRIIALDFEKRGFIVYVSILDQKDKRYVEQNTITDDVQFLDVSTNPSGAISALRSTLATEIVPLPGAKPHLLRLSAVVFTPSLYFPLGPLENTPSNAWNTVLMRLGVYTSLLALGLIDLVRSQGARIIAVIPTIVSSLRLSYHGAEAVFQNALKDIFGALTKELRPQRISVTQVRLGNLDLAGSRSLPVARSAKVSGAVEAEVRSWPAQMQALYAAPFLKAQTAASAMGPSIGSQGLRGLHHLLFDLIFEKQGASVVYYGSGARTYERVACFLPTGLVNIFT